MLTTPEALVGRTNWNISLALGFRRTEAGTILSSRRHDGPLVVQKPLFPEGRDVCHAAIVHAPGGIAGGDRLALGIELEPRAHVLLTTPAATRWYKSAGRSACQETTIAVGSSAILEWLPQETIVFDQADARTAASVELSEGAVYAGWEITCLGRRASGEIFECGSLRQTLQLRRAGRLVWTERLVLRAGERLMGSAVGLGGHHVSGTMIVAAGSLPVDLLDACRAVAPPRGEGRITALPEIAVARYLGSSGEQALAYFETLRAILRPWYASRQALKPRLWDT